MTGSSLSNSDRGAQAVDGVDDTHVYRRLVVMDPPGMRSLIVELTRMARESSTEAGRNATLVTVARAKRNAQALAAAQAAYAAFDAQG